jgi:hypothetical protein
MAGTTLADAQEMLDTYLSAEREILKYGQSTGINDRRLTRADLQFVAGERAKWERKVAELSGAGPLARVSYGVPV